MQLEDGRVYGELLRDINNEDKKVALAVEKAIPQIEELVTGIGSRMKSGGRPPLIFASRPAHPVGDVPRSSLLPAGHYLDREDVKTYPAPPSTARLC
ncbi:hypothetical protein [Parabacteroides goldsteinii]|uniref:hypothetical protein n=1 Tax=Parabacteroides goldsteinii TaxID=328812 RepID=UPI0025A1C110|nr:hypothetical protein [Parabacteroides goldsteinii]